MVRYENDYYRFHRKGTCSLAPNSSLLNQLERFENFSVVFNPIVKETFNNQYKEQVRCALVIIIHDIDSST